MGAPFPLTALSAGAHRLSLIPLDISRPLPAPHIPHLLTYTIGQSVLSILPSTNSPTFLASSNTFSTYLRAFQDFAELSRVLHLPASI
ncbi:hypothetical protein PNOK_0116700 [Pyrrhoderma noxium]|uniref:Uncharacterized protein n=1 Tax=Pyrrhoderma noxium TaxID=2282107 RepID=A0A286UWW4_9AGAM|nr:hypothetical protein PNOK_0116700 [Pyrrhoderma noxium]